MDGRLAELLGTVDEFEWDSGNADKNLIRHGVRQKEAEQAIMNLPVVAADARHSQREKRFAAYGQTDSGRLLTVVFTLRGRRARVISARPMSRSERRTYAEEKGRIEADT